MTEKHSILFIDDEPYILKSLERLFEDEGYEIITSLNGKEALELLNTRPVTVIVSDFRMPDMDGVQVFESATIICPDAIRVMLTGYADIESIISAINHGQVFRFITKPWNGEEFKTMIQYCIKHHEMLKENKFLAELSLKQNEELKTLNISLQKSIDERTMEIHEKNKKLELLYKALDISFFETIKLILKVIEMTNSKLSEHCKKVMNIAENIAKKMELPSSDLRNIQFAALLHDMGKINIPQSILFKRDTLLSSAEKKSLNQHPVTGNAYLSSIERLKKVAEIILNHHENFDGSGYPSGRSGDSIPLESRIIAVADAYENLTSGWVVGNKKLSSPDAVSEINNLAGKTYDPNVTEVLKNVVK